MGTLHQIFPKLFSCCSIAISSIVLYTTKLSFFIHHPKMMLGSSSNSAERRQKCTTTIRSRRAHPLLKSILPTTIFLLSFVTHVSSTRTYAMIRPDAVKAGWVEAILQRIREDGFKITRQKKWTMSMAAAKELYHEFNPDNLRDCSGKCGKEGRYDNEGKCSACGAPFDEIKRMAEERFKELFSNSDKTKIEKNIKIKIIIEKIERYKKQLFDDMCNYVREGEVVSLVLEHKTEDAVTKWLELMSPKSKATTGPRVERYICDPVEAKKENPNCLRALYGDRRPHKEAFWHTYEVRPYDDVLVKGYRRNAVDGPETQEAADREIARIKKHLSIFTRQYPSHCDSCGKGRLMTMKAKNRWTDAEHAEALQCWTENMLTEGPLPKCDKCEEGMVREPFQELDWPAPTRRRLAQEFSFPDCSDCAGTGRIGNFDSHCHPCFGTGKTRD